VQTFRIEYDALKENREARVRLLGWGAVALFLATFVLVFILGFPGVVTVWVMSIALVGASIGAGILLGRELRRRSDREMVFLMDEDGITKRREGFPDERLNYTEIRSLREGRWRLLVVSTKPYGSVAIPKALEGFETIRAELAKHHPPGDRAETKTSLPRIALSLVAYGLCWGPLVFFVASKSVVPAGVLLLAMLSTAFLIYKAIR